MGNAAKLAIFDIDGTITNHGVVPESVVAGLEHLRQIGYATTVCTGRGYIRAKEALGENFDIVVSADALMILEHGTKITDRNGKILFANYLQKNEIEHIVDFTKANEDIVKLLWFNPPDVGNKIQVWVLDSKHLAEEAAKRGHYADVFTCSYDELKERLLVQPLSNVTSLQFGDPNFAGRFIHCRRQHPGRVAAVLRVLVLAGMVEFYAGRGKQDGTARMQVENRHDLYSARAVNPRRARPTTTSPAARRIPA